MRKELYSLIAAALFHQTFASFCGTTGVPFSLEVLPSGAPILGCAQPTCIAGLKSKKDDSNFLVNLNGQADGFMREEENDNRAYSSNLYDNKLIANCSGQFSDLSCLRKDQWVGGIEYIDHPRQPLILQCCSFSGLRFSQDVGVTNVGPGEAITGGEVIRDGRQISFDVIANVRKVVNANTHIVTYEVTVRRMHCLPDPPEPVINVGSDVSDEIVQVLTKGTDLSTFRKEKALRKENLEEAQDGKTFTDTTARKINQRKQYKKWELEGLEEHGTVPANRNEAIGKPAEMIPKPYIPFGYYKPASGSPGIGSNFSNANNFGSVNGPAIQAEAKAFGLPGVNQFGQLPQRPLQLPQQPLQLPQQPLQLPQQPLQLPQQLLQLPQQPLQVPQQPLQLLQQPLQLPQQPEYGLGPIQPRVPSQISQPGEKQKNNEPCSSRCQQTPCLQRCNRGLDPVLGIPTLFPLNFPTLPTFPTLAPIFAQTYPTVAPISVQPALSSLPGYVNPSNSGNAISLGQPLYFPNVNSNGKLMQLPIAPILGTSSTPAPNGIPIQPSVSPYDRPALLSGNQVPNGQVTLRPLSTFEEFMAKLGYNNISLATLPPPGALLFPPNLTPVTPFPSLLPSLQAKPSPANNQMNIFNPGFDFQQLQPDQHHRSSVFPSPPQRSSANWEDTALQRTAHRRQ